MAAEPGDQDVKPISVLIVDDHLLFCEGLAKLLKGRKNLRVVGVASNGERAVEKTRELMPDVILMDVHMPGLNGLEATRRIKQEMPAVHIVMLTISEDTDDLFEAIKSGAQGYLLKNTAPADLYRYIVNVSEGEAPISGLMAAKMLTAFGQWAKVPEVPDAATQDLTEREKQVLECVAEGLSNRAIAERLRLSDNTIKKHLGSVLAKLHLQNRVQAALYANAKQTGRTPRSN